MQVAIFASVAQSVEQRTENPRVVGSIPTGSTICGFSSSGRAPPCHGGGSEFEPRNPLHYPIQTPRNRYSTEGFSGHRQMIACGFFFFPKGGAAGKEWRRWMKKPLAICEKSGIIGDRQDGKNAPCSKTAHLLQQKSRFMQICHKNRWNPQIADFYEANLNIITIVCRNQKNFHTIDGKPSQSRHVRYAEAA